MYMFLYFVSVNVNVYEYLYVCVCPVYLKMELTNLILFQIILFLSFNHSFCFFFPIWLDLVLVYFFYLSLVFICFCVFFCSFQSELLSPTKPIQNYSKHFDGFRNIGIVYCCWDLIWELLDGCMPLITLLLLLGEMLEKSKAIDEWQT